MTSMIAMVSFAAVLTAAFAPAAYTYLHFA